MISDDRNRAWIAPIGAMLLAFWLAAGLARAEGSFFKDRRDAAQSHPAQSPPPSPTLTPVPRTAESPPQPQAIPVEQATHAEQAVPAEVSGSVSEVQATDTFVVAGRRVQLAGVRGGSAMRDALQGWIVKNGSSLSCSAAGQRYRCSTANGKDVGQVVLQNGGGEADTDAPPDYRAAEAQARSARRGIWAQR